MIVRVNSCSIGRVCLAIAVSVGVAASIYAPRTWAHSLQESEPAQEVSAADKLAQCLGAVFRLKIKENRLEAEICDGVQAAAAAIQQIDGGRMSGMSTSSGGSHWEVRRETNENVAIAVRGQQARGEARIDPTFGLAYVSRAADGWRMVVTSDPDQQIRFWAAGHQSPAFCYVYQQANGSIFAARGDGQTLIAGEELNFGQLLAAHPNLVNDGLIPELRRWGVTTLHNRFSTGVRDLLLKHFSEPQAAARAEFGRVVNELSATSFEARERASEWLEKNSTEYSSLLIHAALTEGLPPEPRVRIRKTLENVLSKSEFETFLQVESQRLTEEAEILVWLLAEAADPATCAKIGQQLQEISGEDWGVDAQAWQTWLVKSGKKTPASESSPAATSSPPTEFPSLEGPLRDNAAIIGDLIPLVVTGGKFELNREIWSAPYGGKSVAELATDLRQYAADHRLPAQWIIVEPEMLKDFDYPHLIFARLEPKLAPNEERMRKEMLRMGHMQMRPIDRNPVLQVAEYRAALEVDEGSNMLGSIRGSNREPQKTQILGLTFNDLLQPQNSLYFSSRAEGSLRILVTGPACLVQIFQFPDGRCCLDSAAKDQFLHREFANADELVADAYCQQTIAGLLSQYGIKLPPTTQ